MKKWIIRVIALLLVAMLLLPMLLNVRADEVPAQATVLFTQDQHSHLLP